uniref:hypothetical protein n=1 Tax=uncultured Oceanicoccus sp. TaxID=1706381 RepID=UPI0030D91636
DTDSDGLTHLQEFQAGTEPDKPDSDGDRMPDGWEVQNGLNPLDAEDANSHTDEDGFSALEEYRSETDPNDAESIPPGVLIDFNGTDLPESLQWINEGNQSWALDTFKPLEGRQSLKSGTIAHNQSSRIKVLVISAGGLVRFNLRVSSESCCDYLSFFLDDQLLQRWSGTVETTVSFELPAGYHVLEWRYHKDHSVNRGNDAAWIDQLFISAQENVDSDTDGIDDLWEWGYFGDLNADLSFDTDSDGLTHLQEFQAGTEPNNPDSDGDQMPDGWEVQNGLNPLDTEDASSDIDSDADGIDDPWEWKYFGNLEAGPSFDTDSDGLTHLQEFQAGTAPDNPDFDGDLMPDGWEVDNGLNPLNSTDANGDINDNGQSNFVEYALSIPTQSINMDSDEDRLPDLWEARYGLNPLDASDAGSDEDEDGFSALEEYVSGDDPNEFDSAPIGIDFDFEGEVLPESLSWIHEGSGSWELDQSDPLEGEQSLKSSGILENDYSNPFNQSRVIKTHLVSSGGIVRFDLKVAPGSFNDTLQFYLDDQLLEEWARNAWSGVPQTTAVFYLPAGVHELKWLYYKPYSGGDRSYAFWLDRLFISLEEDSDADGVMDSWELRYFGHLDEDLSQDSDGDGLTHLQEVESGTDPN